jgi:hypothetical protein
MMTARKKKPTRPHNVLANRTASVSMHRNGLSIEIDSVPAVDASLVAKCLLDVVRELVAAGYGELIVDAGGVHGSTIEIPDDDDGDDYVLPIEAVKRVGFM